MSVSIHEYEAVVAERDAALAKLAAMQPHPELADAIIEAKYAIQKRVGATAMLSADRLQTLITSARKMLP